ncbi:MAG: dihydrodipicolinate synthase family protein [Puniceicoccales bacterium]
MKSKKVVAWSATPTPLTIDGQVDCDAVESMVGHHISMGTEGLLLGGTCGEGPWLPDAERERLVRSCAKVSGGRLTLCYQVTDNSVPRVLDNIVRAAEWGADSVVVASPYFMMNASPDRVCDFYMDILDRSPLQMGYYERGKHAQYSMNREGLDRVLRHPKLQFVKDSSCDPAVWEQLSAAKQIRSDLKLFNGDEFDCIGPALAGYDGFILGGGIFITPLAREIVEAVNRGEVEEAERKQAILVEMLYSVYGEGISSWMAGLKYLLVKMGVFRTATSLLSYELSDSCRESINRLLDQGDGLRLWEPGKVLPACN